MSISTEWAVWVQGMDIVLPALDRADAHKRAHKANEAAVWIEANRLDPLPESDQYRPVVWAFPAQYGPDSPLGDVLRYPADWTDQQVEDVWEEWDEQIITVREGFRPGARPADAWCANVARADLREPQDGGPDT